jgi:capsular exopolysaccharide synthesis family protein
MVDKYDIKREDGEKILGTSYYLANDVPVENVLLETNVGKGVILPNVDNVVNPSMLLESKKLEYTLNDLTEEFRYVVVDCPPLDLVSDGERIGSLCDGAILVARGGVTPKSMIKNSIRQLERANCPLLGVVLNRVKGSGSGYYYKQYGGKYGYYGKSGYGYYGKNSKGGYYYN